MEILQTIALLCQLSGVGVYAEEAQLRCQKYYVKCLDPLNAEYKNLSKCIQERKL
jgi:hypothetical protein